jgi:thiol:disulfide interchange protein DsbD
MLAQFRANRFRWLIATLALAVAWPAPAAPKTRVHLLLSVDSARPGDTIWAGLKMEMAPAWHVYWRNGGDAGEPVTIKWTLPDGISAGDINWPLPGKQVDKAGDSALVTYVYSNEVILLTPMTLAAGARPGPLTLRAAVHWQECSELCVLADADVQATLTVAEETKPSADAALIEHWRKRVPAPAAPGVATAFWESSRFQSNSRPVVIEWKTGVAPADFYPDANTNFSVDGMTETLKSGEGGVRLRKMITKNDAGWPGRISGVLVDKLDSPQPAAVEAVLAIQPPPAAAPRTGAAPIAAGAVVTMLCFGFLGGLILNVMPCVLPVIALKILGFVKQSAEAPGRVRNLGLVYGVGVLVSFLILAGLAIGVQRAGGLANWGDAVRDRRVQLGLTVLVTLVALNLFGVFEVTLSSRAAGAASQLASRPGYAGAFFNGMLATVLATPCTAPFMGAALAFAFTQRAWIIVVAFLAVGAGFAFPFVVLCAQPRWMGLLPRPGVWMERFKVAMGFPMLGTAVWLMWFSANGDSTEILRLAFSLVVLALAAWVWGEFVQRSTRRKGLAMAICLVLLASDCAFALGDHGDKIAWQTWSAEGVLEAQRAGHPVLVDFTAKSCLNCLVNKGTSLEIDGTRAKLKAIGAVAFVGDFTREDPVIGRELRHYGRPGVPLVLVYSKDTNQPPEVLPPILTPSIVLAALDKAGR